MKIKRLVSLTLSVLLVLSVVCFGAPDLHFSAEGRTLQSPPFASWEEFEVVRITNEERMAEGLLPLTYNEKLQAAVSVRAEEQHTLFSHTRPDGTKWNTALTQAGVKYRSAAENIAYGYRTPAAVMNGWMNSSGHYANIMNSKYAHLGAGYSYSGGATWAQLFYNNNCKYTSLSLYNTGSIELDYGESLDESGLVLVLNCSSCGKSYLPLSSTFSSGYNPNRCGKQTVKVNVLGLSTSFTVTVKHHYEEEYKLSANCKNEGYTLYKCSYCGDSYKSDFVSKTDHTVKVIDGKAATCTEKGLTDGKACSVCKAVLVNQTEIPAKGHSYTKKVTAPTCVKEGYTNYVCSDCGNSYKADYTNATGKHVYSDNYDTTCNSCGYIRKVTVKSVPMYRMYDKNGGEHFYTGSTEERDFLVSAGWQYEGVGFNFPVTGKPVYRLYERATGEHLYTMDENEKAALLNAGWEYEGVAFNSAGTNEVPQYRLHNPNATRGAYHFTGSIEERDLLISVGWEYQGIGFYSCLR